jgi:hypothetical protein
MSIAHESVVAHLEHCSSIFMSGAQKNDKNV